MFNLIMGIVFVFTALFMCALMLYQFSKKLNGLGLLPYWTIVCLIFSVTFFAWYAYPDKEELLKNILIVEITVWAIVQYKIDRKRKSNR